MTETDKGPSRDGRWAVYFTPRPDTALAGFGATWFDGGPPRVGGVEPPHIDTYARLTARPRLYGFHATVKAPFRLAADETKTSLSSALIDLAQGFHRVEIPPLQVALIDGFLALVPTEPCHQVEAMAAACMRDLDRFRAALTDAEYARRGPDRLTDRQREFLRLWGYPYVLEEFRWHMTLTDRLDEPSTGHLRRYLGQLFASNCGDEAVVMDSLSLVYQPAPESPFGLVSRAPLRATM